jgi:LytS/YehU family sensor histidine kinase
VLKSLIDYLRAAMPRLQPGAPSLANEVALVKAYLALMQLRMPDRLRVTLDVPADLQALPCLPLALMTLVENAVRHAIDPSEEGGHIQVGADRAADGRLRLWVQDDGPGLAATSQPGTGLHNLRARLQASHGPAAQLCLTEVQPHGLRAEILVPPGAPALAPTPR